MDSSPATSYPRTRAATSRQTALSSRAVFARLPATRSHSKTITRSIFHRRPGAVKVPFGDGFSDPPPSAAKQQTLEPHSPDTVVLRDVGQTTSAGAPYDPRRFPLPGNRRICTPSDCVGLATTTSGDTSLLLGDATTPLQLFAYQASTLRPTMSIEVYTDQLAQPWENYGGPPGNSCVRQATLRVPRVRSAANKVATTLRCSAARRVPEGQHVLMKDRDLEPASSFKLSRDSDARRSAIQTSHLSGGIRSDKSDEDLVEESDEDLVEESDEDLVEELDEDLVEELDEDLVEESGDNLIEELIEESNDDSAWEGTASCVMDEDEDSLLSVPLRPARRRERAKQRASRLRAAPGTPSAAVAPSPSLQPSRRSLPLHHGPTPDMTVFRKEKNRRKSESYLVEQRKRRFWTQAEELAILTYVNRFGTAWRRILDYDAGSQGENVLQGRTNVDLKDKAVNLATTMIRYIVTTLTAF